jgi:hypothetical protein
MDLGKVELGADAVALAKLENGEVVIEVRYKALGVLEALIDSVEKAIPGDQTGIAMLAKSALQQILK